MNPPFPPTNFTPTNFTPPYGHLGDISNFPAPTQTQPSFKNTPTDRRAHAVLRAQSHDSAFVQNAHGRVQLPPMQPYGGPVPSTPAHQALSLSPFVVAGTPTPVRAQGTLPALAIPHAQAAPAAQPTNAQASSAPAAGNAAKAKPSKAKGAGARSGANRRNAGGSEDEVSQLSQADLAQAAVTPRPRVKKQAPTPPAATVRINWTDQGINLVVDKVTSPEVWPNFKIQQSLVFDELVIKLAALKIYVTRDQVRNLWNRLWRKYKEARRVSETTGGAGDVEARDPTAEPDGDDDDSQTTKKRKRKAKGGDDDDDEKFSRETLLEFSKSAVYAKIDEVAHDDPDVVRSIAYSSADPIEERPRERKRARKAKKNKKKKHSGGSSSGNSSSDADSDSDSDVARHVLTLIKERTKRQARLDKENLAIAEEREKRDTERLRIEREKHEREQWVEYERCKASADPVLQRRAVLLAKSLLADD